MDSGSVFLGDIELNTLSEPRLTELRAHRVGFVFQSFNVLPTLTAGGNVVLPLRIAGAAPDRASTEREVPLAEIAVGLAILGGHGPNRR